MFQGSFRRIAVVLVPWVLGTAPAHAAPSAGTEANFGLGAGSRGMALGGAFLADVGDVSAIYWNPADLGVQSTGSLGFMHAPIGFGEAAQTFVGVAYPTLRAGGFGAGFMRLGTEGIQAFDAASNPLGAIEYAETGFYLSWGWAPPLGGRRTLALGTTVKTRTQSITPWSSTAVGLDAGLRWQPLRPAGWSMALMLQDLVPPRLQLDQDVETLPRTLRIGTTVQHRIHTDLRLAVHLAGTYQTEAGWRPAAGVEMHYREHLGLRLGASHHGLGFGIGVRWDAYAIDYTLLSRSQEATHPVSFGMKLGSSVETRWARLHAAEQAAREKELAARLAALVHEHLQAGEAAYGDGDYARALEEWKVVLEFEPGNESARRGVEAARTQLAAARARALRNETAAAARAAQFEIGLRYYAEDDYLQARNVWLKLLEQDPDDVAVRDYLEKTERGLRRQVRDHVDRARRHEAQRDYVSALEEWNAVARLDPVHPDVQPAQRRCRAAIEKPRRRSRPERRPAPVIVRAQPTPADRAARLFDRARAAFADRDYPETVRLLREALQWAPDHEAARRLLEDTERRMRPLTERERQTVRTLYLRGMDHFMADELEAAIEEWTKILELDPDNDSVLRSIQEARARLEDQRAP